MELAFTSLSDAISKMRADIPPPRFKSQRAEMMNELYSHYEKDYRKQKWREYVAWLKTNRKAHSKDAVALFKKQSYPKITVKSFCSYWLGHIPTSDLYYLNSIARDYENRGGSFNKWLFWSLKVDKGS